MAHPLAGKPAPASILVNVPHLVSAYYTRRPNMEDPAERVSFGTSGHRGSALRGSFNEAHIIAISAAIVERRTADDPYPMTPKASIRNIATPMTALALIPAT